MYFNYKRAMENEEPIPDDGLEVTKAINAQAAALMKTPDQISTVSDQVIEAAKKEEESGEDTVGVDQSDDGLEADPDNAENISNNIDEATEDASALEAILDQINKSGTGLSLEAYGVAYERLRAIRDKYDPRPQHFYNDERVLVVSAEGIRDIASAVWKFIKEQLAKLKDLLVALYQMSNSKLKVATEDVNKYRKVLKEAKLEKPKKAVVTNPMFGSLTNKPIPEDSPQDIVAMLTVMSQIIGGYQAHLKKDYPLFIKSINDAFGANIEPTVVQDANGVDQLQMEVDTHITRNTVPGYVKRVGPVAADIQHAVNAADTYLSSMTMPHGVKTIAKICGNSSVIAIVQHNGSSDSIQSSRMYLAEDPNYTEPGPDLPVMTKAMLGTYLKTIEGFITQLHTGEYFVKTMIKDLSNIEKFLGTEESQLKTLKELNNATPDGIFKYRDGRASVLKKLIALMNGFFISMNQRMMLLGNSYLAASLKYSNAVCAQYTGVPEEKPV